LYSPTDNNKERVMAALFSEIPQVDRNFRPEDLLSKAMKRIMRPSGARITVLGVGGGGRNAIRNLIAGGISKNVKLVSIDTDVGSDQKRYS